MSNHVEEHDVAVIFEVAAAFGEPFPAPAGSTIWVGVAIHPDRETTLQTVGASQDLCTQALVNAIANELEDIGDAPWDDSAHERYTAEAIAGGELNSDRYQEILDEDREQFLLTVPAHTIFELYTESPGGYSITVHTVT